MMSAHTVGSGRFTLAEGPQANPDDGTVSWVDIEACRIHIGRLIGDFGLEVLRTVQLSDRVGCAIPLSGGRFLVGLGRRLALVGENGRVDASRELLDEGRRFNDGIIDPAGRLIIGSLSLTGSSEGNVLLRLEHDGSITTLDDDVRLANGMGFSPDARTLYVVDSLAHVVYSRDYDSQSGAVGPRRIFVEIDDCEPDGLAVDREGDVWVALWRGHGIRRFGADGTVTGEFKIGPPHVTSLCFVPGSRGVLVTTASYGMTDDDLVRYPDAGALFFARANSNGRPMFRWKETALPTT